MKKNRTTKVIDGGLPVRKVQVEFAHEKATKVCIAGAFNDWRPDATPMLYLGNGRWIKELVLRPGVYEYQLVVDGEWMPDPRAGETVPNPFGGVNSVLKTEEMRELSLWARALRRRIPANFCL